MFAAAFFIIKLNVKATSDAVNGLPFDHVTPGRILKVTVLPPLLQVYAVASHGSGCNLA